MKGRFEAFFTTQNNRLSQIELRYTALLNGSIAPVDVPRKLTKLLKIYAELLEVDRAYLKKSLNRVFTYNPSEKKELLEIEDAFFKSTKNKLSKKLDTTDAFKVALMPFDEGRRFYDYIQFCRRVTEYCKRVSAYLLQLKWEIAGDHLKYLKYDVYEKGSAGVLNVYMVDPVKDVRALLANLTGNEADESLLILFADITKILAAGNDNAKAAAFYDKQLQKIAALDFSSASVPENNKVKKM